MRLLRKKISYQEFLENVVIKRIIYKNGKLEYKGECNINGINREEFMTLQLDCPEDIFDLDVFAGDQLTKKLLKRVNIGV